MIHLSKLQKLFGTRMAVEALDLCVPAGEIFGLLGHNGAGKSTTIGMMLGQVWPTSGEVRLCGFDITRERRRALQKVGAIFESPVFYDYLSGRRNLEILSHYTAPTSAKRINEVIDWVGLSDRANSLVRTYSHGMRTRLALAQALLPQPLLLILDEPSDGLDPEGIHEMRHTISRLHRELGLTILLSSHLLNEVEQLCTRIAVMKGGRKVFEGSVAEARRSKNWVTLRTESFENAARSLLQAGLIQDSRGGRSILPTPGIGTERIVCFLVEQGLPVFEIALEKPDLEEFYLDLMQQQNPPAGTRPAPSLVPQ